MKKLLIYLVLALTLLQTNNSTAQIVDSYKYVVSSLFTTQYQAVLDEATAQGYGLPTSGDQIIQDARVISAIASGVWADSDCIFVFTESGDADFKMINWKNPSGDKAIETFHATPGEGALVWASTGVKGDGLNFIDTGFNPSLDGVNYLQDDAGAYVSVVTARVTYEITLATTSTANDHRIRAGNQLQRLNSATSSGGVTQDWTSTLGLLGLSRNTGTDLITSVNTTTTTTADASVAIVNSNISLLGWNWSTAANWTRGDAEIAYFIVGADMSGKLADIKAAFD